MSSKILSPVFSRPSGAPKPSLPLEAEDFDSLYEMDSIALRELGLSRWNSPEDPVFENKLLWLFPKEWYEGIPNGFDVVNILGKTMKFERGVTSDSTRYGYLAYGVLVAETKTKLG